VLIDIGDISEAEPRLGAADKETLPGSAAADGKGGAESDAELNGVDKRASAVVTGSATCFAVTLSPLSAKRDDDTSTKEESIDGGRSDVWSGLHDLLESSLKMLVAVCGGASKTSDSGQNHDEVNRSSMDPGSSRDSSNWRSGRKL
jgi:hypothetical protein